MPWLVLNFVIMIIARTNPPGDDSLPLPEEDEEE